jgi:hypothetical protein
MAKKETAWMSHLMATKKLNPKKKLSEVMKIASKSYSRGKK